MSNVLLHQDLLLDLLLDLEPEAQEVDVMMEETDLFVADNPDVAVLVVVAAVIEVDAENGCWFAKIHQIIGVVDAYTRIVLVGSDSHASHRCQSHLYSIRSLRLRLRLHLHLLLLHSQLL